VEDLQAYIESGILELYVLGELSPDERLQVEGMAAKHKAVKAELDEIELQMELYADAHAVEPSEQLRGRILNSVVTNFLDDRTFDEIATPKDNVVAFTPPKQNVFYKYAFAACLALLLTSGALVISLYGRLQDSNQQLAVLQSDKQHFANRVNFMEGQLGVYRDTAYKFTKLQATTHAPAGSVITVAFNKARKKVMVDMANMNMPENDQAHQYQLWALVGGKPIDLGVFDKNRDSTDMKEMKSIASVDAFAVTLEPRGGSINPTMDQLMVIGKF
jgi:anti-sigma-K factor RskA